MYIENNSLIVSASDLVVFSESEFASWMDHFAVLNPEVSEQKDAPDPLMTALANRGTQHEVRVLEQFRARGLTIADLSPNVIGCFDFPSRMQATQAAMQTGSEIIYQAALCKDNYRGYADFLVKVPNPTGSVSLLGDYHYEVWDAKLATETKPAYVIQLSLYADILEFWQGIRPQDLVVVLGDFSQSRLRTDDYFYVYRALKERFEQFHSRFDVNLRPDPTASRHYGQWTSVAEAELRARDHLSRVANITRTQIKRLNAAGIHTTAQLAKTELPRIPKLHDAIFARLKAQAAIQCRSECLAEPAFEVLRPERGGLASLPAAHLADIFFDIEGFPLEKGGLEYLWGVTYFSVENGAPPVRQFRAFWAHDSHEEKAAFSEFILWVYARWQAFPQMHIYHYANYEIAACRRLMGRYGVCEYEVDQLLRNEVFVDLYKVVKSGLRIGCENYSIKSVEHLYRGARETAVGNGGDSVVAYEAWRRAYALGDETKDVDASAILSALRDYNKDDCDSTQELADWLHKLQAAEGITPAVSHEEAPIEPEKSEKVLAKEALRNNLLQRSQTLVGDDARITENMAWMLEFHRREDKPAWWRLFERLDKTSEELEDDLDCVANCVRTDRPPFKSSPKARNLSFEYRFDINQEVKPLRAKDAYVLGADNLKVAIDDEATHFSEGLIVVKAKDEPPSVMTLIPNEIVPAAVIEEALNKTVERFTRGELAQTAIDDFLRRRRPRIADHDSGAIVTAEDSPTRLAQIINAVVNLQSSYLAIQGPPGAGKTYTAKHIIAELIRRGCRVGISSNSHKAINNLLVGAVAYCRELGLAFDCACGKNTGPELAENGIQEVSNSDLGHFIQGACIVGSTAWAFCREELTDRFDYLFIDEAGQVSVANLIAMSRSTHNIVLMGDQMQLGQPLQGSHPADSGLSILDYLLQDTPIMPPDMGVFLETTYRMHPAVNAYISGAIYQDQLNAHPSNRLQTISVPADAQIIKAEAGIVFIGVVHEGNSQASDEEVEEIVARVKELLGRTFTDKAGNTRPITLDDMLFVTPYNHQVNKLRQALGDAAKVGSVDKFQGQEAPIVFFSLCSSNANESPRGLDFLFDKHRINVAISRAQSLAIIVGNPNLLAADWSHLEQMKKTNVVARLWMEHRV